MENTEEKSVKILFQSQLIEIQAFRFNFQTHVIRKMLKWKVNSVLWKSSGSKYLVVFFMGVNL